MISFNCVRTIQSFLVDGVQVAVVRAPDGQVRLKVHLEPGSSCKRLDKIYPARGKTLSVQASTSQKIKQE